MRNRVTKIYYTGQVELKGKPFFNISYLCNYSYFHCSLLTVAVGGLCD